MVEPVRGPPHGVGIDRPCGLLDEFAQASLSGRKHEQMFSRTPDKALWMLRYATRCPVASGGERDRYLSRVGIVNANGDASDKGAAPLWLLT